MIVALYILVALVAVGLVLKLTDRRTSQSETIPEEAPEAVQTECCGLHAVCEKDSLIADHSAAVEYFDDEELDEFAGRGAEEYNSEETEMFRDVLQTLRPEEVAAWGRSVQQRGIELPSEVRDEFLMLIDELRN